MNTSYSYRGHLMAGRPYVRTTANDDMPSHRHFINYAIDYPQDL